LQFNRVRNPIEKGTSMSVGAAPAASAGASAVSSAASSGASASAGVSSAGAIGSVGGASASSGPGALPAAYSFGSASSLGRSGSAYGMDAASLQSQIDAQNKSADFDKNSPLMQAIAAAMLHKQAFG
jgi:hypothetical protein